MTQTLDSINRDVLHAPHVEARIALSDNVVDDDNQIYFPVDVDLIAQKLNLKVHRSPLDASVAGLIVQSGEDQPVEVFINQSDRSTRQRFTLAHEIGHFVKRTKTPGQSLLGFIDYRDELAGRGTDPEEIWANAFAAELLMPSFAVRNYWASGMSVQKMAKEFDVSRSAMETRISALRLA